MLDLLPDILPEERKGIAEIMQKKHEYPYRFFEGVREEILETILNKRLMEDDKENVAALYLAAECGGEDDEGNWHEIDPDYQELFDMVFGKKFSLIELPSAPWADKIFRLLIAVSLKTNALPDLRDNEEEWKEIETSLFWRFAQMTKEEYIALFQRILTEAIRAEVNAPAQEEGEGLPDDIDENGVTEPFGEEVDTDMGEPQEDE
jgi:hypothetical protein